MRGKGSKLGFGPMQLRITVIGTLVFLAGVFSASSVGQRLVQKWRPSSSAAALSLRSTNLLIITVWFALLTGLIEVSILADKKFSFEQFIFLSPHVAWMAPLADLVIFSAASCCLVLIVLLRPGLISLRTTVFVFALLGFLSLLFMVSWLHRYAALALAIGLAVQTSRVVGPRSREFYRIVQRTSVWMVALVLALAVLMFGWQKLSERREIAGLPAPEVGSPNVLLIVLDTVRAQNLSLYGYSRPTTPNLERWARSGVTFERALATAPWTIPSHASMFTGRFPHETLIKSGATWDQTRLDSNHPTLAEIFKQRGYLTAGFTANMAYSSYETGLDRGFIYYKDYPVSVEQILISSSLYRTFTDRGRRVRVEGDTANSKRAAEMNADFLRWLSHKGEKPFFGFVNYFDGHEPYQPPQPFDTKFGAQQTELDAYDGSIAYLDHQIGLLLDELKRRELLDNTLVIITSDHGEHFGEHNLRGHGNSLYLPLLHVPLVILFPGRVPSGERVRELVTLRDLPATVVDLLKINDEDAFPGNSLARYWSEASPSIDRSDRSPLLSELRDMKSLILGGYHYIVKKRDQEELYDIERDPLERENLALTEEGRRACEEFRQSLVEIVTRDQSSPPY